jgi:hypothetical protein
MIEFSGLALRWNISIARLLGQFMKHHEIETVDDVSSRAYAVAEPSLSIRLRKALTVNHRSHVDR